MNKKSHMKKFAIFVLLLTVVLTLAACTSKEKTPYGSISNDEYASLGNNTVTEKQLYDAMRKQGTTVLAQMIDKMVYSDTIADLDYNDEFTSESFDHILNKAIYSTTYYGGKDKIEALSEVDPLILQKQRETFANSLYLLDNTRSSDDIFAALETHNQFGDYKNLADANVLSILKDAYASSLAQILTAKEKLTAELDDEDHDNYIDTAAVVSYYESQIENKHNVKAFIFSFENDAVAQKALKALNLKFDSYGNLYQIPDLKQLLADGLTYDDIVQEDHQYHKIYTKLNATLTGQSILKKIQDNKTLEDTEFDSYRTLYTVSKNDASEPMLTEIQVLQQFVLLHDYVNPTSKIVPEGGNVEDITAADIEKEYTQEDITKIGSTLTTTLYKTLINFGDTAEGNQHSFSTLRTAGTKRYLVIKFADIDKVSYEINKDDSKNIHFEDISDEALAELRTKAFDYALENKLTDTYITEKRTELYKDLKVDIYDPVVRMFYEHAYDYSGTTKNRDGKVLAKVAGKDILVDDFYAILESSYGVNIALDLLVNKHLLSSKDYTVTSEDRADYEKQFKTMLTSFSQGAYESSGYPASLGREKFIKLAFGADSNKEALELIYILPELKTQFYKDYDAHYSNIFEKFAELAKLQQDNLKSITVSHLLVAFDKDRDGTIEDPADYYKDMTDTEIEAIETKIITLINEVFAHMLNTSTSSTDINKLVTEFNNVTVLDTDSKWYPYYELGIKLNAVEAISSAVTNSSNFQKYLSSASSLDQVFHDRALAIYDHLMSQVVGEDEEDANAIINNSYIDFYTGPTQLVGAELALALEELSQIKSAFGYHIIMKNTGGITMNPTAEYDGDLEDFTLELEDGRTVTIANDTNSLNANQLEFFVKIQETEDGLSASLPKNVNSALTQYFTPVTTFYKTQYMQRELLFKLLSELNISFKDADNAAAFATIRAINRRQLFNYINKVDDTLLYNADYQALYGSWFDILEA